jgi:uncharacterized protein (TIGR03437 family)
MGYKVTLVRSVEVFVAGMVLAVTGAAQAQSDWHHIGNAAIDLGLADPATGPVERVWYSAGGALLLIRTSAGKVFGTTDFETWQSAPPNTLVPPAPATQASHPPEGGAQIRQSSGSRLYAFGTYVYRSDDTGAHWNNLTSFHSRSLIGGPLFDLAISPTNPDEIVAVGYDGVFRSVDAGLSWSGLNESLPNLPGARILALPLGSQGLQADLGGALSDTLTAEWAPGERLAWRPTDNPPANAEHALRGALGLQWGVAVTSVVVSGDYVYSGTADGQIRVSPDRGRTWQRFQVSAGGPVTAFAVNPGNPQSALATLGSTGSAHVVGTVSAGRFWDSLSAGLADVPANGIAADWSANAVYIATGGGVFFSRANLTTITSAPWTALPGLPAASATDVKLDAGANRLWVALEGYGIYEGPAPHRIGDPHVVSAADYSSRPVAPGTVLSVPGAQLRSASAGQLTVPVLDANPAESQIQVPFNVAGSTLALSMVAVDGRQYSSSLPMSPTAPAILVNADGSPLLLDADNFVLDSTRPAHARERIQILAIGLGAVQPDLPAGTPAPLDNPPQAVTNVTAWLDGQPVLVLGKAVLAPGLIGYYLVEIEIPSGVNFGPAELYIEAGGQQSNRVRVYIEP